METTPKLTDEELSGMGAMGQDASKAELKAYHDKLIAKYGQIPVWAGPFHYCPACRFKYPKLCKTHQY